MPSLSADGRFVAFSSYATNLVPGDTNNVYDIFVRDRQAGTTERISLAQGGGDADDHSTTPAISAHTTGSQARRLRRNTIRENSRSSSCLGSI